ncbi:hypothetical protein [Streptomyces sp. SID3343]|uniref:hypothetical protein n=1 Tax=Streptomyces sp. SID3343 TaxID=2690260 RepID=UPI00136F0A4B|nr:hypothetical protein [Streptomyces sp. SID3343]MYW05362.1 hypothetical protein [Streptomyces sp. SID3343]
MTDEQPPAWAARLRSERARRLWSQKDMAIHLRDAADGHTRARLPSVESIQRYVRDYETGRHHPRDRYAQLYCRVFGLSYGVLFDGRELGTHRVTASRLPTRRDAADLTAWMTSTNIGNEGIAYLARTVASLSEAHSGTPPRVMLADVIDTHQRVQGLLRSGRQRLKQTRELMRLDAVLIAHAGLLLGDLNRDASARAYGRAAVLCARESETNEAVAWSALAKTARWEGKFRDSADLARRGFECSDPSSVRILLACQEANGAALSGDRIRATEALARAEVAAESVGGSGREVSAWSCPRPRQALFALSVATSFHEPEAALRAAMTAHEGWAAGDRRVATTWAQIQIGVAIAHVQQGAVDGAVEGVTPMLSLAPELRMATVTRHLANLDRRLQGRRFRRNADAIDLRARIREFGDVAMSNRDDEEGG